MKNKNKLLVELGVKIKTLRKQRKLTQEDLEFESGVDRSFISRIERGINNPTYLVLLNISKALNCSIGDFL